MLSADLLGQKKSPILLVADKKAALAVLFETYGGYENEILLATIFGGTGSVSGNLEARIADAITADTQ